jgi:transcription-repair coupling factor (superfamily II helicase)
VSSDRKAVDLIKALRALSPDLQAVYFPGWDCLPYDRASPSRVSMGRRLAALRSLAKDPDAPWVVVTSPLGIIQRIPPKDDIARAEMLLKPGDEVNLSELEQELQRFGYIFDERVDEPGEVAVRGQVIDVFPADAAIPVRIEHQQGQILALRPYDAASQLASGECEELRLIPASECFSLDGAAAVTPSTGSEHRLPEHFGSLDTLFSIIPKCRVLLDTGAERRIATALEQIQDAFESRSKLRPERAEGDRPLAPDRLYMTDTEWAGFLDARNVTRLVEQPDNLELEPPPLFATGARSLRRFADFVVAEAQEGNRVVLAGAGDADLRRLSRAVMDDLDKPIEVANDWASIEKAASGQVLALPLGIDAGFRDPAGKTVVVAAADVFGSRARSPAVSFQAPTGLATTELELRIGDVLVHLDHGLGVLEGIESVDTGDATADLLRLSYADDATLMVPADEMDRLWRYGASSDTVSLDRIDGDAWTKRREKVEAESAALLVQAVKARTDGQAPKLVPPRAAYERFVSRFPYEATADQASAISATLADLESGRPANRLVCGDVGFGKTEVALRAAAAAALAGKQVAVVAPTTVLARQHVQTFERRFAGLGIKIGHLSRLVGPTEAKAVKAGLADGTIHIVVGTHAVAGKGVRFMDLGLVIIDEEQRFGAAHKAKLKSLAHGAHVLTLTATPIPRTMQSALVGLQDLSVIATPPSQRQPIRTFVIPFDGATVREALLREQRRSGQSFVVCPRIEDIEPLAKHLKELVPELETVMIHGGMSAGDIDDAMVRFADGEGSVLLATNIIESGLDVPRANTMLVWRPDRFGLSQLHQLRGRVGRGRVRGVTYLMTDPAHALPQATRKRLETLASLDRLGAGFAISARDLDQRGAGDLFGEDQAGHMKLIGVSLYQDLLSKAVAHARGEGQGERTRPDINIDAPGYIPEDYVPEPEMRINLYAQLCRLDDENAVDAFEQEIENRFGSPPSPVVNLVALARLREHCRHFAVSKLDAGPQAVALTFGDAADRALIDRAIAQSNGALQWRNERLLWTRSAETSDERRANAEKVFQFLMKTRRSLIARESRAACLGTLA